MEIVLVAAFTFLECWLADKGFQKLFRGKPQHRSGQAVRLNKLYATAGLVLCVLGVAAIFTGIKHMLFLIIAGAAVIVLGIGLIIYYLTFGLYYDSDSFLVASFGKKDKLYRYSDIQAQQLYNNMSHTVIELYLADGEAVLLQANMTGVYDFMDKAFSTWLEQTGKSRDECPFYDPDNSCWFPPVEG